MLTANAKVSSLIVNIQIYFQTYAILSGWKNPNFTTVMNPPRHETPTTFNPLDPCHSCDHSVSDHIKHLQGQGLPVSELDRLLSIVVDVGHLFICFHNEEDSDTKQVFYYLFNVSKYIF